MKNYLKITVEYMQHWFFEQDFTYRVLFYLFYVFYIFVTDICLKFIFSF